MQDPHNNHGAPAGEQLAGAVRRTPVYDDTGLVGHKAVMSTDHNVRARRMTTAFRVIDAIPDAQMRSRCIDDIPGHDARCMTQLTLLLGAVAEAVASSGDVQRALLHLSQAAHGWMDDIQQIEAR